jgi:ABC-type bacteriocin/lantibiotic exporter with double-glycine peptidase domain
MLLSALGMDVEESHLRHLTDCTPLGTEAFQVIEAARHLGFPASRKYTFASLDELASVVADGAFPIVYVDVWPLQGGWSGQIHAFVVVAVDREQVTVLDPLVGERRLPRDDFQAIWAATRFLTLVIAA